ncbi:hypothetical protein I6I99_21235 [Sphingobacterium multivorum]|nr:hypothetical protein [Sphingobacterium multivorum]QQT29841.1 hypothetical protein I6I99_21235 [Sphingobacterium multivorum]
MKSTDVKLKHLFYCLIPIIIVLTIEWMDNFIDWKKQNLILRKDVATATIIDNPFYHFSNSINFLNDNGEFDLEKFENALLDDGLVASKKIKYSYNIDGDKYIDSLNYMYSVDYSSDPEFGSNYSEWDNQLSKFMPVLNRKPEGTTFKIYYYKNLSIPAKVVDEVQKEEGFFRLVFFNGYFGLWSLAIFISYLLFSHYFFDKKNIK